jgi:hypothetical protein
MARKANYLLGKIDWYLNLKGKQLRTFHIHIDGQCVPNAALAKIGSLPFEETPFRRDLMSDGFEAPFHYTYKTKNSQHFKRVYKQCCDALQETGFDGYVEGECLAYDCDISHAAYNGRSSLCDIEVDFAELDDGQFRETELHIAFEHGSDDAAVAELKRLGFFSAFMDKSYGLAEILTLQGSLQAIQLIEDPIRTYLRSRTTLRHCSMKREDIARFWLTRPNIKRAPILVGVRIKPP